MAQFVYTMHRVGKVVPPKREILKDISLSFFPGAKIGVLGLNGSGKSTLLRIMAGLDKDFSGEARPQPDIKIGFLPQEPVLDESCDVRGNVEQGIKDTIDLVDAFNAISEKFAAPMSDEEMNELLQQQGELQDKIDAVDGWEVERILERAADALRLPPWDSEVAHLSGGEKRRIALCRLLLSKPDMLLLDEPTNHLDAETVQWLEDTLKDYPGNVIVSTHDRYFLDNITKWILELDKGRGIPFEGNYSAWLEQKTERLRQKEKTASTYRKRLEKELEWLQSSPGARRSKNKFRVREYEKLVGQQSGSADDALEIQVAPGPPLGDKVIECRGLSKGYSENLLIKDFDLSIPRGAIVGLIGPNGAGKTTLFRMIVGEEKPDSGTVETGPSVVLSYVDQNRHNLDGDKTIFEEITGGADQMKIGDRTMNSRAYVARFNFRGADQQKKVSDLSGGERNRVHLAKLLRRGGNVLLLDEPTNDLDVTTLRSLENAILEFSGCVMVISHDRFFLDRICTHLLAFEGNGVIRWFEGNFEEYLETRRKELGGRDENRRSRHKKLTIN